MARAVFVLVLVVAMVAGVKAESSCVAKFPVAGLKCKLKNRPVDPADGLVCPEGNPSTVTFCKAGKTVKIVGYFEAPDLGVCDPNVNRYTLPADAVVTYEQYGDQVIFRIPSRVPSAFRCMMMSGKKVCVGLNQRFGVTYLTDCVPAGC